MRSRIGSIVAARPQTSAPAQALLALLGLALAAAAAAHHSINGMYDNTRKLTFSARIVEVRFVNPHPYLVVEREADAAATVQRYRLEMDNRHELTAIGMTPDTLRPGDRVVVTGSLNRTDASSLYLWRLDRAADGLWYEQIGFSPKLGHGPAAQQAR